MAIYHGDYGNEMARLQEKQREHMEREARKRISKALTERERMIYKFQKDFILAVASRDGASLDFGAAKERMEAATLHLYPPVTEINAEEYLNRAY